ncbi:MAG TPA: hypothetical protein DEP03_18255 [Massilia sp.]|nr:hypothetical protein [Massilia sp.]
MKLVMSGLAPLVFAATLLPHSAGAQVEGLLNKGGHGGGLKGLAGMASGPMTSGSMGNVAGLLQYCIGNNYLSGEGASSVKDQLMGKLPAGSENKDPGYSDGRKGLLHGSNGNMLNLGGGLTAEVTKKACDTVLAQAKSFL